MINLFQQIIEISLTCSLVIIAIGLCSKLTLQKYSVKWRYFIWLALAIRMVIPITPHWIEIPLPAYNNQISISNDTIKPSGTTKTSLIKNQVENTSVSNTLHNDSALPIAQTDQITKTPAKIDNVSSFEKSSVYYLELILTFCWIIGCLLFLSYHFISYFLFLRKMKRWQIHNSDPLIQNIIVNLCADLKIRKKISISTCKDIPSPMMVGFFQPQIILPQNNYSESQLNVIVKHELVHYKKHDLYYKLLLLIANSIHWFNPFVHFMVNEANHDLEMACDETVIKNQSLSFCQNYSLTILQIINSAHEEKNISFSTYFYGSKKQLKNRFQNIMNIRTKNRKGIFIFIFFAGLTMLTGNLTACGIQTAYTSAQNITTQKEKQPSEIPSAKIISILLIGIDQVDDSQRSDSIILATINPEKNKIILTSFLRDSYVSIPGYHKNKLNTAYVLGGASLLKETIEASYDLTIDGTITADSKACQAILNTMGGVQVNVTADEADYLNTTNFISKPSNRNLKEGVQLLNGNQALGYVRIRNVPTKTGEKNDFGRTQRQRNVLAYLYNAKKSLKLSECISIVKTCLPYISTDISREQLLPYVKTLLSKDFTLKTLAIPAKNTFEEKRIKDKSVLVLDLKENETLLKETINQ